MVFKKFRSVSFFSIVLGFLSLICFYGCSSNKGDTGKSYSMGEAAGIGSLTYNVLETEWKQSLDGTMGARAPQHRFLLVNLSITNTSEKEVGVPFLTLINAKGVEFRELDKGEGVASWLGVLRRVGPDAPLHGKILFDAPPGGYKLRISSGGAAENETTALVALPFRADPPPVRPDEPVGVPSAR